MSKHPRDRAIDWDLRVPTAEQLRSYMDPVHLAFAEDPSGPEIDDWIKLLEPDRWIGAFEGPQSATAAGGAAAISVRLTVPGGEVPAAAVTAVGVRPDQRRRGVLSALMRRQLADVHERREPVAILWASEGAIYQRYGYGLAAPDGHCTVTTSRAAFARPGHSEGQVRIVSEEDSAELIPPVYEAMRAVTPGAISRSRAWWVSGVLADPEYSRQGLSAKFRVVYEADGQPEGYAIYRVKGDWDERGPQGTLEVREAVTNTPRALRGLWRYLFGMDLVRTVRVSRAPVPNPLQLVLAEPRALGLRANDGLWLRLVDLPAALAARRYGAADTLVLEVSDELCPSNAGRWQLRTSGTAGEASAEVTATKAGPDLMLDVTDLGAAYLGGTRASSLAAAGRIVEREPGAVRRMEALFAADRAPWCVSMF